MKTALLIALAAVGLLSGHALASDGYSLADGTVTAINQFGVCYNVTNNSAHNQYVPVNTAAEWSSFYSTSHPGVSFAACTTYTHLLLHMDGTNGSTTFTDSSSFGLTPTTRAGDAQISTATSKFGGSSGSFDGTGDYLIYSNPTVLNVAASQDFAIEMFFYLTSSKNSCFVDMRTSTTDDEPLICYESGIIRTKINNNPIATSASVSLNTWHHVAMVRTGGLIKSFLDGTQFGSNYSYAAAFTNMHLSIAIPVDHQVNDNNYHTQGYFDEFRYSIGTPRYTGNFTPASAPFGPD